MCQAEIQHERGAAPGPASRTSTETWDLGPSTWFPPTQQICFQSEQVWVEDAHLPSGDLQLFTRSHQRCKDFRSDPTGNQQDNKDDPESKHQLTLTTEEAGRRRSARLDSDPLHVCVCVRERTTNVVRTFLKSDDICPHLQRGLVTT